MNLITRTTFGITGTLLAMLVGSSPVYGQAAGLSISPPVVEILLAPNKKVTQAVTVKNQGETSLFQAALHKVTPKGIDGHTEIDAKPLDPSSIPVVITLGNADIRLGEPFTIGAGSSQQIVLTIEGTSVDTVQDTYLALVVTPVISDTRETVSAPGISSLVLITLTPADSLPLGIEITDVTHPFIHDPMTPLSVHAAFTNNTSTMVRPNGNVEIITLNGTVVEEIAVFPHLILGSSSRRLAGQSQDENPEPVPLVFSPAAITVGPRIIRITASTAGGTKLDELEVTVWFFPFRLAIVLSMLLLIGTVMRMRRRRKNDSVALDSEV